jgi:hypothetical protein
METKTRASSQVKIVIRDARGQVVSDETYQSPAVNLLYQKRWAIR